MLMGSSGRDLRPNEMIVIKARPETRFDESKFAKTVYLWCVCETSALDGFSEQNLTLTPQDLVPVNFEVTRIRFYIDFVGTSENGD